MMKNQLPMRFAKEHGTRIGLLPPDAKDASAMIWFDMPAFVVMHTANAWEEEDGAIKVRCKHFEQIDTVGVWIYTCWHT